VRLGRGPRRYPGGVCRIIAGAWFASPATAIGHELIAAGLLILAGSIDRDLLKRWLRIGYERARRSRGSYDPDEAP
jgi:hypothetical protein